MKKTLFYTFVLFLSLGFRNSFAAEIPQDLAPWARDAVLNVMTFAHDDIEVRKEASRPYFTADGFDSFYKAMEISKIPEVIVADKLRVEAKINCAPEIIETNMGGVMVWQVRLPIALDYMSEKETKRQAQSVTLIVKKDVARGAYGIDQWVASSIDEGKFAVCGSKEQIKARIGQLRTEIAQREVELKALQAELGK